MIFLGCQVKDNSISVNFKTVIFDLYESQDSIDFIKWQQTHLDNNQQIETGSLLRQDSTRIGKLYYSDKQYLVYGYCMGEFGGALLFQDKNAKDSIYYLECTCPVMIDKRKEGYYVIQSLAHGDGFGKIQFFESPTELVNIHLDSLKSNWKTRKYPTLTKYEIWKKLTNQGTILIDSNGLMFNLFFPHQNKNYLIFSDHNTTYLGLVTPNNTLITIDTLFNSPTFIWGYNPSLNRKNNGYYHYKFERVSSYSKNKTE